MDLTLSVRKSSTLEDIPERRIAVSVEKLYHNPSRQQCLQQRTVSTVIQSFAFKRRCNYTLTANTELHLEDTNSL